MILSLYISIDNQCVKKRLLYSIMTLDQKSPDRAAFLYCGHAV